LIIDVLKFFLIKNLQGELQPCSPSAKKGLPAEALA